MKKKIAFISFFLLLFLFSLSSVAMAADYVLETEPNNTYAQANNYKMGTSSSNTVPVIGDFSLYDLDYYKITVTNPGTISVLGTSSKSYVDLGVAIYDSNDNYITSDTMLDDGLVSYTYHLNPGTYYLVAVDMNYGSDYLTCSYVMGAWFTPDPNTATTGIINFNSSGTSVTPSQFWKSAFNAFSWSRSKEVAGDFNGDGKKDVAILYNYGNNTTGIFTFLSNGTSYTSNLAWKSATGSFSWDRSKPVAGDFNADGKDDIGILYNYGNNTTGLFGFTSSGSAFTSKLMWKSGAGGFSWANSKVVSGDFSGDSKDDIALLYNYGNNTSGLFGFTSSGSAFTPKLMWKSGAGGFSWNNSKITSGNYDGLGKDDVAVFYNYGNNTAGIFNFISSGTSFAPKQAWKSGVGGFSWANSKVVSGNFNGDSKTDVGVLYNYGNNTSGLFNFKSTGTAAYTPSLMWKSTAGGFSWGRSLLVAGDSGGDGKDDLQVIYNYANN